MPSYDDLRPDSDFVDQDYALIFPRRMDVVQKKRAIDGILRLKTALDDAIPQRRTEENLLVASWNIKEFGHLKGRLPESYFYIAEVIARFDLVVIHEVKSTLVDLQILMRLLGDDWDFLVNDITSGRDGNSERSAYIFNSRRVELSGTAGELVLWDEITKNSAIKQFKRTPYLTGFRAGWKEFALLSFHLQPDDDEPSRLHRREEVGLLLAALGQKTSEHWTSSLVLAGDFNFYAGAAKDDITVRMIEDAGYYEVDGLKGRDTTASGSAVFDRMFIFHNEYFQVQKDDQGKTVGGVFPIFDHVFRTGEEAVYKDEIIASYGGSKDLANDPAALAKQYRVYWKRNQISDHLPIWFELVIDNSREFLLNKRAAHG